MLTAKAAATGVNELLPPENNAAQKAATPEETRTHPHPERLSPRGTRIEQAHATSDPNADDEARGAENQSDAEREPDPAVGQGGGEVGPHQLQVNAWTRTALLPIPLS